VEEYPSQFDAAYYLVLSSPFKFMATDGTDLGWNSVEPSVAEPTPEPEPEPEPDPVVTSISIATASLPEGVRRKAYAAALAAADADGAITWAVSSGSLPPGLSLDAASGIIAGTCGKPGNWTFTVSATDLRATATRELSIHVRAK